MAGAAIVGWWSFQNVDYGQTTFLGAIFDPTPTRPAPCAPRPAAAVLLLAFGLWRLVATPATPQVVGEDDPDFLRVRAILAAAEVAEPGSNLALLGDKRFLFSDSGGSRS